VTSRHVASVEARSVPLDRLQFADVCNLLDERGKTNVHIRQLTEQERHSLYEDIQGNPLLIKWLVAQLGRSRSQCRTLPDARAFLNAAPPDNDPLEYIYGDVLETCAPNELIVLATLVHFSRSAKLQWIVDVTQLTRQAVETVLEDLKVRSLVLGDEVGRIYSLAPLTATFLRRKCSADVIETGERLAKRAFASAEENGHNNYERYGILEAEWPLTEAALPAVK
jgi:hypothetical protein